MSENLPGMARAPLAPHSPKGAPPVLRGVKRLFADEYCRTGNELKAAHKAGAKYRGERELAHKMLGDAAVQAYIRHKNDLAMHGLTPTVDAIRSEIHALAHGSLGDLLEIDRSGNVTGLNFTQIDKRILSQTHITFYESGKVKDVRVRAHPKLEALRTEAQMAGMLTDDSAKAPPLVPIVFNVTGNVQINNSVSGPEERP